MAQDKITEIFDIDAIKANRTAAINEAKAAIKELQEIQSATKGNTTIGGSSENAEKASKSTKELTASLKEYIAQNERLIVAQAKLAQSTSDDTKALAAYKVELANVTRQQKEEAQLVSATTSAYEKLNIQHKQAVKAYQDAAAAAKLSAQEITKLKDNANKLGDQLVKIDSAVGNYRRNVGNYSSAWNGLGMSIQQVARELPNFAQSMQLGMLAISNNIPILADEIKRAKDNIAALKAEGKDAPSLFSQIGKSIFSWQTAMVLAITVGMKLAEMWEKGSKAAQESAKALEKYKSALNNAEETERSAAQQQIARMNILTSLAADNAQTTRTRTLAVEELQKTYPTTFGALEKQAILEGRLGDSINKTTQALLDRAAAQAAEKKFAAASENIYDLTLVQRKAVDELTKAEKEYNAVKNAQSKIVADVDVSGKTARQFQLIEKQQQLKDINNQLDAAKKDQAQFLKDAKDSAAKAGDILFNDRKTSSGSRASKSLKQTSQDVSADVFKSILDQMNDFETQIGEKRDTNLRDLLDNLSKGEIGVAEYEARKKEIVLKSEDEILQEQLKYLQYRLESIGLNAENTQKVIEKYTDLYNKEIKKRYDSEETAALTAAKNLEGFQKAMLDNKEKADKELEKKEKEQADREKAIAKEKAQYLRAIAEETMQFIFTLLYAQSQRELTELDKKKDRLTEEYDLKTKAVENAAITEDERAARKAVLDAEELERQKQIDKEVAAIKRKQAIYDKAQAIATIGINTAVAISKLVAQTGGLGSPLIPLIIALGAAQAATVLATPIPEYAKGKKETDSYEGLAIAGEKGTEMRINKEGDLEILDKPTLIYTKRGDTILSNEQLKKGAAAKYVGEGSSANYNELIKAYSYNTERTIKAIKSNPSNVIIDNTPYHLNIKRARA